MSKRLQILKTAEDLLAQRGLYGLSMKVLADTAGIAAGTIYRYFDSKETLILELHQHIRHEASENIFQGWSQQQNEKHKYNLLWRNTFDAVLNNPKRLAVIEMLCFVSTTNQKNIMLFEDATFLPLLEFYQKGINEKRFHDWPVSALIALSFDSAINLAKKVLREGLAIDEQILTQVRDASWDIIQNKITTH